MSQYALGTGFVLNFGTYIVTDRSPRLHITLHWREEDFALFDGALHSNGACIKLGDELQYCFIALEAVERIRRMLGLEVAEVAVFGDDLNDLDMICHYPNSIAMGNAVAEVKAAAGYVTATDQEDGIALGLKYLLEKDR